MKVVTDSDINQLLIEALDFNAQIIALCTSYFGSMTMKSNQKKIIAEYTLLSNDTEKRRRAILGITSDE